MSHDYHVRCLCGETSSDTGPYQGICLARIRREIEEVENKLAILKAMSADSCDFFAPPEATCTLPKGHAGVHLTIKE